ncbi:protransforming growth factor alpha [Scleropages formosus]|uniref:protransforming growth factor alpha n=1 Tax=Scleropages formosus TaxID=113540 RepID=UPI0010FA8B0C|nr:protransforming growth factor alpha [Scleropages formosus]
MERLIRDVIISSIIISIIGSVFTSAQLQENSTTAPVKYPLAAAVRSHFDDCPRSHEQFCFHGTCRFLVQEETPACVCHAGFVGMRCEHADLLAVVATNQKQQPVATLLVLCVVGSVMLILFCTILHCCRRRGRCVLDSFLSCCADKPSTFLKGGASCCHSETVV